MSPVPRDIYKRENVWWVEGDQVYFHPWVYRLAYPKAINRYKNYYDRVNKAKNAPFPKEQFMESLRKIKSRGYQRKHRARKRQRGDDAKEDEEGPCHKKSRGGETTASKEPELVTLP